MSHHTSPPPYQQHTPTPQASRPHHSRSTNTHKGHSHGCGGHRQHVHQPSIIAPTRPVFQIASRRIHSRYNETDHLLPSGGYRRNDDPGCYFFTIIAVTILAVLCLVQFFLPMPIDKASWTNLESHSCTTFATREYVAELDVSTWNPQWTKICMSTPVVVHGQSHLPFRCESRFGTVIGHFAIKYNEPDCVTYWDGYKDWGCTARGSRKRHIEQHLMNVPINADYKEFCATTPTFFLDQTFSGADSCLNSIWGVYGQWFINDPSC